MPVKETKDGSLERLTPQQNGWNLDIHEAIDISLKRAAPQGADNTEDAPRKRARGGWEYLPGVIDPLQWYKRPEEDEKVKPKLRWNTPLQKNNEIRLMPPNSHILLS